MTNTTLAHTSAAHAAILLGDLADAATDNDRPALFEALDAVLDVLAATVDDCPNLNPECLGECVSRVPA